MADKSAMIEPDMMAQPLLARLAAAPLLLPRQRAATVLADSLLGHLDADEAAMLAPLLAGEPARALVAGLLAHSPFLGQIMRRHPDWLAAALAHPPEPQLRL
jgi:glutamate-ammonia-ligase adenylyltransferase